ncbi:hypothetical protein YK56LOC_35040 [Caballeronia sp. HLA56]
MPPNALDTATCDRLSTFTLKRPAAINGLITEDDAFRHTTIEQGSVESEVTAVAAMPNQLPSCAQLITLTLAASRRMHWRKS